MLERLLTYIDEHIEEPLSAADIARQAGYSPFHFSRMFTAMMGIPVMEYVRLRKLQHAAAQLAEGERILDIALRYGFESHEGFTRAFKRVFSASPAAFRAENGQTYAVPPPGLPLSLELEKSFAMRFAFHPQSVAVGYRFQTQPGSPEIPGFWKAVMTDDRWKRLMPKMRKRALNYGLCIHPYDMPVDRMDYMIAFDYDGKSSIDRDMELYDVPSATCAIFSASLQGVGTTPNIVEAWAYIYSKWFPSCGYSYDGDKPAFEAYDEEGGVEIYIPVVKVQ